MWCDENEETAHFTPIIAQTMEVDFAGKTFEMTDRLTGEVSVIVVFVAVLPYTAAYIFVETITYTPYRLYVDWLAWVIFYLFSYVAYMAHDDVVITGIGFFPDKIIEFAPC